MNTRTLSPIAYRAAPFRVRGFQDINTYSQRPTYGLAFRMVAFALLLVSTLACDVGTARAAKLAPVESHSYRPYPPLDVTSYVFNDPRPIRAWTVRVDLTSPDIEFVTTQRSPAGAKMETACATTRQFAKDNDVQLAINASPFSPLRGHAGEDTDIIGLAVNDGDKYSTPHPQYGALLIGKDGKVTIAPPPLSAKALASVDEGVGGFHILLQDGTNFAKRVASSVPGKFANPNPRTAVGLSADGKTMWIIVIDGRHRKRSEGMSLAELTDFAISLGCVDLLNMDGGGSTTLVLQDRASKAWRVVNQPVGRKILGTERFVGNNLGIRIRPDTRQP